MKLLFITSESPYPANSGGRLRVFNLCKEAAKRHSVSLAYFDRGEEDVLSVKQSLGVEAVHLLCSANHPAELLMGKVWPAVSRYASKKAVDSVLNSIESSDADVIVLETSYLLPLCRHISAHFPNKVIVLDAQNVEYQLHRILAKRAERLYLKLFKYWYSFGMYWLERSMLQYLDAVLAVSESEAQAWRRLNDKIQIIYTPNGVDVSFFEKGRQVFSGKSLVFCGLMDYRPNVEAMLWFCRKIWPKIHNSNAEIKLYIVGRNPTVEIEALSEIEGVQVTGAVDDVRPWVWSAALVVVPLLSGGGTRLKILEAMAMEKVVVSTSIGAEGLQRSPGVLLADSENDFASKVNDLLCSSEMNRLGEVNRRIVKKNYSWTVITRNMLVSMKSLTEEKIVGNRQA